MTHTYRWRKYRPDLYGQPCRVIARGTMNSCLIELANGTRHVVSRYAVRRIS